MSGTLWQDQAAFPFTWWATTMNGSLSPRATVGGLTKREHFAALAMQGLLASDTKSPLIGDCAEEAVVYADALLEALGENDENDDDKQEEEA